MHLKKYYKEFLLGIIILLIIGVYIILWFFIIEKNNNDYIISEPIIDNNISPSEEHLDIKKYVEVKGEVANPGVYAVVDSNIINDVINMAGGFTDDAYTLNINLSKKVKDEMVIYIYSKYEYEKNNQKEIQYVIKEVEKTCNCPSYDIKSCTNEKSSIITSDENINKSTTQDDSIELSNIININTATKEELMTLDGIGEAKAKKIIDYRNDNGIFKSTEEIKNVSGISDTIYENIKEYITV